MRQVLPDSWTTSENELPLERKYAEALSQRTPPVQYISTWRSDNRPAAPGESSQVRSSEKQRVPGSTVETPAYSPAQLLVALRVWKHVGMATIEGMN